MECYDLLGVGFGPSNLSVAIALEELNRDELNRGELNRESQAVPAQKYLEAKHAFHWHPHMMMPGTKMQVSFLKDLATLRNPSSPFTFLNYLKANNRLEQFANLRDFFPSRHEYNDYFQWAAAQFDSQVEYSTRVRNIAPVVNADGSVSMLKVNSLCCKTGREKTALARNVILGLGGKPRMPEGIDAQNSLTVHHAANFLQAIERYESDKAHEFVVVGSGQSAAEIFNYLMDNFPNARVKCVMRGYAFKPSDDSEFVNEIFSSKMVDTFYSIGAEHTRHLINEHRDTNYSVVDPDLIKEIYHKLYQRQVCGNGQHKVVNHTRVAAYQDHGEQVSLSLKNSLTGELQNHRCDGAFLATGYERTLHHSLLSHLDSFLQHDEYGNIIVDRNYRVETRGSFSPGIYLQGTNEHSHGLSDTLLSMIALRSEYIARSLFDSPTSFNNKQLG